MEDAASDLWTWGEAVTPTIYLSNWGSWRTPSQHGPGRKLCAMAEPRDHELGDGTVPSVHPDLGNLVQVRARKMSWREYLVYTHVKLSRACRHGDLVPGTLAVLDSVALHRELLEVPLAGPDGLVQDGDTLLCACPRRGSTNWERPCHLEVAALYLARSGWSVVLYGRVLKAEPVPPRSLAPPLVRYADTGTAFRGGLG